MAIGSRIKPSLIDKLVAGGDPGGEDVSRAREMTPATLRYRLVQDNTRFNEEALRHTVRRDIAFLLNATNLASLVDLDPYPNVATSVLNYGVPDLAGKAVGHRELQQRRKQIRVAILAFEPRIADLDVQVSEDHERENAVTFLISGDITSAVRAIPIRFRTDIEVDTAAATVRE